MSESPSSGAGSGPTPAAGFGARLAERMDRFGRLCVGIDPDPATLATWGLPDTVAGVRQFALTMAEACAGAAAAVKPQVAYFERFGSAGFAVLEELLTALRDAELLSIADAKRGDIGSTMAGYASAWLDPASPLAADAVTLSPYLGPASLAPALDALRASGKGAFLLAATSNPEAASLQLAGADEAGGSPLAQVLDYAAAANASQTPWGNVGVVFGATMGHLLPRLPRGLVSLNGPILAPGFDAQGATAADMKREFGPAYPQLLVNSSRGIAGNGPSVPDIRSAITAAVADLAE